MGTFCNGCKKEQSYERVGRWNPKSIKSNRRLYDDESVKSLYAESGDDDFLEGNGETIGASTMDILTPDDIADAKRGFREAIECRTQRVYPPIQ